MKRLAVALALATTLTSRDARADEAEDPRWYGYQPLVIDVASATMFTAGVFAVARDGDDTSAATPILLGLGGYVLGGPIVHWAHGHVLKGFVDLGLRLALPLVGLGLGTLVTDVFGPRTNDTGAFAGTLAGVGAAMVADAAILGWEPPPRRPAEVGLVAPRSLHWQLKF